MFERQRFLSICIDSLSFQVLSFDRSYGFCYSDLSFQILLIEFEENGVREQLNGRRSLFSLNLETLRQEVKQVG